MNSNFIHVSTLEGELKLSQTKSRFKYSITTKELIFQKPFYSYQIQLADIISMVPHQLNPKSVSIVANTPVQEPVIASFEKNYYKLSADKLKIYNNNGVFEKGKTQVIVPLNQKALEVVAKYSNLVTI